MVKLKRRCKCGCGEITSPGRKWIPGHNFKGANNPRVIRDITGKNNPKYKHGLCHHKLYTVWCNMKARCYDNNSNKYQDWGGRGIKVYIRWRVNFISFYNWSISHGWKENLEIDRIDNDGNYHPNNCRFVTTMTNCNNRRTRKDNTTGYPGVAFRNRSNKYESYHKNKYIGQFKTAKEAAKSIEDYKNAEIKKKNKI